MLAFNHFHWIDPPAFGAALAAHDLLHGEGRGAPRARARAADPELRHVLRPPRRVRPRGGAADARRSSATGTRSASSPRGRASASGVPGRGAAGRGDGRRSRRTCRSCRPRSTARRTWKRRQLAPGLGRLGRAVPLRRPAAAARRATAKASVEIERRDPRPLGLARRDRTRSAGRAGATPPRMSETATRRLARHGRDRRLPERRQVDADQPADRDARGGRPRDARRHARPQGAARRLERRSTSCSSTRAASTTSRPGRVQPARSRSRRAPRSRRPTSSSSSSTPGAGSRPATRSSPTILRARAQAGARAREQDRRPAARRSRRSSSTGSASATRSRSRRCTATAPATCSTRSSRGCRARAAAAGGRRGDPRRDPRPPERRQVVAPQRARRRRSA